MMMPSPESIRDLAAGYALGALTPEETRAFEGAMAGSPELAREVAEYREVNALLAQGGSSALPPSLRGRLMDRIEQTKAVGWPAPPPRRRWVVPALGLGLAAALVAALGLSRQLAALRAELEQGRQALAATAASLAQREETLNTLLTAEADLTVVQLTTAGPQAPGIQFFWNRRANQAVIHAFRLPPAAAGKVYQLWLIRDGVPIPSQTFNSDPDGHSLVTKVLLPAEVQFQAAAVTMEPTGGSQTPTLPILLVGSVTKAE